MTRYRKFITSGVAFTFLVVGTTGIIFQFFFKNHLLVQIHGWLGVGMVTAALLHIFQNGRSLLRHLRNRRVYYLVIPIVMVAAYQIVLQMQKGPEMPPRQVIRKLFDARAVDVATVFGKNLDAVFASMRQDGLKVDGPDEKLLQLARDNGRQPENILLYFTQ